MNRATEAIVLRRCGDISRDHEPPFETLGLEQVTPAWPEAGEVLIDVATAAICHSDLSVLPGCGSRCSGSAGSAWRR